MKKKNNNNKKCKEERQTAWKKSSSLLLLCNTRGKLVALTVREAAAPATRQSDAERSTVHSQHISAQVTTEVGNSPRLQRVPRYRVASFAAKFVNAAWRCN